MFVLRCKCFGMHLVVLHMFNFYLVVRVNFNSLTETITNALEGTGIQFISDYTSSYISLSNKFHFVYFSFDASQTSSL